MTRRDLVVVTGSSGVGKSTLAAAFQETMLPETWFHFSVDSVFYCLPRSIVERVDHHDDRSLVDSSAVVACAYACARALLDQGQKLVFDAVILNQKGAERLLSAFEGYEPLLVEVSCAWEEIQRRTLARGNRTLGEAEHGYRNAGGHVPAHLVLDSSNASPSELAMQVAAALRAEG